MIIVSISQQQLYHRRRTGVAYVYPISTASKGVGNRRGSWQTPIGRHRIATKIGVDMPIYTAFIGRNPVGIYQKNRSNPAKDWILTRIIRLRGDEVGINRRGICDTFERYIYIHGTHEEDKLGTPASHGCIRMGNRAIMNLFKHCHLNEIVSIV